MDDFGAIRMPQPPEIQFTGSPMLPASEQPSDPAVAAAFIAFHRNTGGPIDLQRQRRGLGRATVALAALVLLGFGGGLFLAFF